MKEEKSRTLQLGIPEARYWYYTPRTKARDATLQNQEVGILSCETNCSAEDDFNSEAKKEDTIPIGNILQRNLRKIFEEKVVIYIPPPASILSLVLKENRTATS
ncbi:hypothetical protein AV530_011994 [Patagioenas fasciata monilis]|uniref:Uncharacterized protein n=1 Tax=Patagioenas fasciata monilis TaxID=372326 RepID=A0A1V4JUF7_PATFA|nr:hypothetical protein AV530_011994 [Patagioenas fasciata monilis]